MKTIVLFIISMLLICVYIIHGQVNIDTLRYEKVGELRTFKVGNKISHKRPQWQIRFNKEEGLNFIYRENGNLYLKGTFSFGKDSVLIKNGIFEYYYKSGQLRDVGSYINDIRTGIWKHYDSNGNLNFVQDYTTLVRTYYFAAGDTLAYGTMKT